MLAPIRRVALNPWVSYTLELAHWEDALLITP